MNRLRRAVRSVSENIDILLLRVPTPRAYMIWKYASRPKKTALLVVANMFNADYSIHHSVIGMLLKLRWIWFSVGYRQICRKPETLVMANSQALIKSWQRSSKSPVTLVKTSCLSGQDVALSSRKDRFKMEPYRLLFVGRICYDKGIRELLRALQILNSDHSKAFFLDIVGPMNFEDGNNKTLERLIGTYGVRDQVQYHGVIPFGPELLKYYRNADVYVIPSYHEGMPKTVWESMSQGTPVIASEIDGMKDNFTDEEDIIFIKPHNVQSIVEGVIKLIDNPELAKKISIAGFNKAKNVTREAQAQKITQLMTRRWSET